MFDDDPWDEERWEAFLQDNDKLLDRLMDLVFRFMRKNPPPSSTHPDDIASWKNTLRAYLQDKGWGLDDVNLSVPWLEENTADDLAAGENGEGEILDFEVLEQVSAYRLSTELTANVLGWANEIPGAQKTITLVHFCSHVSLISANLLRGYTFGTEHDGIGGNIACAKRSLAEANAALLLLRKLKDAPYLSPETYRTLYEQVYEVRNAVALHILALRDRFNLGID